MLRCSQSLIEFKRKSNSLIIDVLISHMRILAKSINPFISCNKCYVTNEMKRNSKQEWCEERRREEERKKASSDSFDFHILRAACARCHTLLSKVLYLIEICNYQICQAIVISLRCCLVFPLSV
jgi:hypothetical protein